MNNCMYKHKVIFSGISILGYVNQNIGPKWKRNGTIIYGLFILQKN